MTIPTLFCLALLLSASAASWISVPLPSGSWATVWVADPGRQFLLHPKASVERAKFGNCSSDSPTIIHVRLWRPLDLQLTERALREKRLCAASVPWCVAPYQARYVTLRDQRGVWTLQRPRRFLPVTLPPVLRLALLRTANVSCSSPSPRSLAGLVIEIGGLHRNVIVEVDVSRLTKQNGSEMTAVETNVNRTSVEEMRLRDEVRRLKALLAIRSMPNTVETSMTAGKRPLPPLNRTNRGITIISDCLDVKLRGLPEGIYFLELLHREVLCTASGKLVVLRRTKMDVDFNKNWAEYRRGFGDVDRTDFFLGLSAMNKMTVNKDRCMGLALNPISKSLPLRTAVYTNFVIGSEITNFTLSYNKFSGSLTSDSLAWHNKKQFSTPDRTEYTNCATHFKSGNWFYRCNTINLFGRFNYTRYPHAGFCSLGLSKESPSKYLLLRSAFMTLRKAGGDPQALSTVFALNSSACPATVREWTVPETAEYLITAGGAAGGAAPHVGSPPGGRAAVAKVRVLLKAGSKLRLVVGCAGDVGHLSGSGGDGTFVADLDRKLLLVAAGGGGGAGWTSGGPGRDSAKGGEAKLAPGISSDIPVTAAVGWESISTKIFGSKGQVASSGGRTSSDKLRLCRGGGGGGGFSGGRAAEDGGLSGEREKPKHSAGGGGGSYCNKRVVESCEIEEGGNQRSHGFVEIEIYSCF